MLREREIAIHGSKQYVIDSDHEDAQRMRLRRLLLPRLVRARRLRGQETEEQMQIFAEEVMPVIARECGGKVELPTRGLDLAG